MLGLLLVALLSSVKLPAVRAKSPSENDCHALKCHRAVQAHGVFPGKVTRALVAPVNSEHHFRIGIWVQVLEGRPSTIIAPVLTLIDTDLGMRLRGCANTTSGD
jgi:hypothetical protein